MTDKSISLTQSSDLSECVSLDDPSTRGDGGPPTKKFIVDRNGPLDTTSETAVETAKEGSFWCAGVEKAEECTVETTKEAIKDSILRMMKLPGTTKSEIRIAEKPEATWQSFKDYFEKRGHIPVHSVYFARITNDITTSLAFLHHNAFSHGAIEPCSLYFDSKDRVWITGLDNVHSVKGNDRQSLYDDLHSLGLILYRLATGFEPIIKDGFVVKREYPFPVCAPAVHLSSLLLTHSLACRPSVNVLLLSQFLHTEATKKVKVFLR